MKRCALINCNSSLENKNNVGITFHKFPTDPDLLKAWMFVFELKRLCTIKDECLYICSLHFKKGLIYYNQNNRCHLKRNSIPSEFNFHNQLQIQSINKNTSNSVTDIKLNTSTDNQKTDITNDKIFNLDETCRTCLTTNQNLMAMRSIFENNVTMDNKQINIMDELITMKLTVKRDDCLPHKICNVCLNHLKHINKFRMTCKRSQNILEQYFKITSSTSQLSSLSLHKQPLSTTSTENSYNNQIVNATTSGFEFINIENNENDKFQPETIIKIESDHVQLNNYEINSNNNITNVNCDNYNSSYTEMIKNELIETTVFGDNENIKTNTADCVDVAKLDDYGSHKKTHDKDGGNRLPCNICKKYFRSDKLLRIHINHSHTEHSCPHCTTKFPNIYRLNNHLKSYNKQFKCDICGQSFTHQHRLRNHKRSHTDLRPYLCYICGKDFKMETCLATHMKLHSGVRHTCSICNKDLATNESLVTHMGIHTGIRPYKCDICSKGFLVKFALKLHMRKHGAAIIRNTFTTTKTKSKSSGTIEIYPFVCGLCNKKFKLPSSLTLHMKLHSEERKYQCSICGMAYKRPTHLTIHINGVHLKLRPYKCEECDKSFRQSDELIVHMRTHTGEKPFECSECNKNFHSVKLLRRHVRIHTGEKPYRCEICNLHLATYLKLASHTKKSHKQD